MARKWYPEVDLVREFYLEHIGPTGTLVPTTAADVPDVSGFITDDPTSNTPVGTPPITVAGVYVGGTGPTDLPEGTWQVRINAQDRAMVDALFSDPTVAKPYLVILVAGDTRDVEPLKYAPYRKALIGT